MMLKQRPNMFDSPLGLDYVADERKTAIQTDMELHWLNKRVGEQKQLSESEKKDADEVATAQGLGITVDKFRAMKAFAAELRRKHPFMTPERVQKKVCKQFNIKLEKKS